MGKKSTRKKSSSEKGRKTKGERTGKNDNDRIDSEEKDGARIVTMEALQEMSASSDSDGELPPREQWDDNALSLEKAIQEGKFDSLIRNAKKKGPSDDEEDSIEEVELGDDDDDESPDDWNVEKSVVHHDESGESDDDDDDEEEEREEGTEEFSNADRGSNKRNEAGEDNAGADDKDDENDDDSESEEEEGEDSFSKKNAFNSKALSIVTQDLLASKKGWAWAESFDVIPKTPLPFDRHDREVDPETGKKLDIVHDDLKREVAFYDMALEAVHEARSRCKEAGVPFSRPDDFFVEMVKTDDHMARVKDRLIFENKKMEAVAQRKANKEHKLRAREAHANKVAEKSKRKREHLQAVEEWAANKQGRGGGGGGDDRDLLQTLSRSGGGSKRAPVNKKRLRADKKYGFGGKRGRFKQNDQWTLNDPSSFNPRGNFAGGGMKKTGGGSGAKRKGKRARDASRSRRA